MNDLDLEPILERLLAETPPLPATEQLRADLASVLSRERQRPPWLTSLKEPPMRYRSHVVVGSPTLRLAAILASVLALCVAVTGTVIAGSSLIPSPNPVVPRPTQPTTSPVPARNGWIAYQTGSGIDALDPSSGATATIIAGDLVCCPTWSPDGRWLAYYRTETHRGKGPLHGALHVARDDGSDDIQVTSVPIEVAPVSWSPDSQRLAYFDGSMRIFGLVAGASIDLGLDSGALWSPDGAWLAYTAGSPASGSARVWVMKPDGSGKRPVTPPELDVDAVGSWSPDSSSLTFLCCPVPHLPQQDSGPYISDIWSATLDGGVRQLTSAPDHEGGAIWSPDGTTIAFGVTSQDLSTTTIMVIAADGSGRRPLYQSQSSDVDIEWSPDGAHLLTVVLPGPTLVILPVDGSAPSTYPTTGGAASWQRLVP